jgi:hypothetical protein
VAFVLEVVDVSFDLEATVDVVLEETLLEMGCGLGFTWMILRVRVGGGGRLNSSKPRFAPV